MVFYLMNFYPNLVLVTITSGNKLSTLPPQASPDERSEAQGGSPATTISIRNLKAFFRSPREHFSFLPCCCL